MVMTLAPQQRERARESERALSLEGPSGLAILCRHPVHRRNRQVGWHLRLWGHQPACRASQLPDEVVASHGSSSQSAGVTKPSTVRNQATHGSLLICCFCRCRVIPLEGWAAELQSEALPLLHLRKLGAQNGSYQGCTSSPLRLACISPKSRSSSVRRPPGDPGGAQDVSFKRSTSSKREMPLLPPGFLDARV